MPRGVYKRKPCSEETKKKISNSEKGKIVSKETKFKMHIAQIGKKQSIETIQKRVLKLKGKKRSEGSKIKYRNSKIGIKNPMFGKHHSGYLGNKNKNTKIELKIETELQKRKILYKKHFNLYNIANVDFYLPKYDSVIQVDGCYWHNCLLHHPNKNKGNRDRDERQDFLFNEKNIKVYRLWEHEIDYPDNEWPSGINFDKIINNIINK
jgi:G:T-mismatch repair DNA endonuclease (very short patch repair protein)